MTTALPGLLRRSESLAATAPRFFTGSTLIGMVGVVAIVGSAVLAGAAGSGTSTTRFDGYFHHSASFDVTSNGSQSATQITATDDGRLLAYTDPVSGHVGLIDVTSLAAPAPAGVLPMDGRPVDVVIRGDRLVVVVDRSAGNASAGSLEVFDLRSRQRTTSIDLRGEPGSIDASSDGATIVAVVSNSKSDAAGRVAIARLGADGSWLVDDVDIAGAFGVADPAPEEVAINDDGRAAVTFPSENRIAIVDLESGRVASHFDAGSVSLAGVDTVEEELGRRSRGNITLDTSVEMAREPGAVAWADDSSLVVAGEGAGESGGGRGVSMFSVDGRLRWDSGAALEHIAAAHGRAPENRAANHGVEPEAVAYARFGGDVLLAVALSRANLVVTYGLDDGRLVEHQVLATGDQPSSIAMVGTRVAIAVASRGSDAGDYPSLVTLYQHRQSEQSPAPLRSFAKSSGEPPSPWGALSGLAADPENPALLAAVSDARYAEATVYTLEVIAADEALSTPERVELVGRTPIVDGKGRVREDLDLEGIALLPGGGAWVVSEGARPLGLSPAVIEIDAGGVIGREVRVPDLMQPGLAESIGHEGVAVDFDRGVLYVASQAPAEGDPAGHVRIWRLDIESEAWASVLFPLDQLPAERSKSGLSDITRLPDGRYAVIERDAYAGPAAMVKRIYRVHLADPSLRWTSWGAPDTPKVVTKRLLADVLDELDAQSIWTPDKPEGIAALPDGDFWLVNDNDGVNDAIGETLMLRIEDET